MKKEKTENLETLEKIEKGLYIGTDSQEDIKKCLTCEKSECNNCLKHKNFI